MNRFDALETRWRRYRRRLWLRRATFIFGSFVIIGAATHLLQSPQIFEIPVAAPKQDTTNATLLSGASELAETKSSSDREAESKMREAPQLHVVNGAFDANTSTILGENNLESLEQEQCYIVKATILNIRERPDLRAKILSRYVRGDEVCTRLVDGNWLFSGIGWIYNGGGTLSGVGEEELLSEPSEETVSIASMQTRNPSVKNPFNAQTQTNVQIQAQDVVSNADNTPKRSSLKITSTSLEPKDQRAFYHRRYEKEPSYTSSIALAQSYFDTKEYSKAYEWALIANNHKKSSPESWAIFAKSLYFSGKQKEAIDALSQYVKFDNSGELAHLLSLMKTRKLKESE